MAVEDEGGTADITNLSDLDPPPTRDGLSQQVQMWVLRDSVLRTRCKAFSPSTRLLHPRGCFTQCGASGAGRPNRRPFYAAARRAGGTITKPARRRPRPRGQSRDDPHGGRSIRLRRPAPGRPACGLLAGAAGRVAGWPGMRPGRLASAGRRRPSAGRRRRWPANSLVT